MSAPKAADAARERVERLLAAARELVDPHHPLGRRARRELPALTGLSAAGVERALERCLEHSPPAAELDRLLTSVQPSPVSHVLLSANVFTAALRAVALGLAASSRVLVRPSRREPLMAQLLAEGAPGLFEVVDSLQPLGGEQLWVYGSDSTVEEIRAAQQPGVLLRAHGHGYGAVVAELTARTETTALASAVARDIALFDQRGCLSPRLLLCLGDERQVRALAASLAEASVQVERQLPLGRLTPAERAAQARYGESIRYLGELFEAGAARVGLATQPDLILHPPAGRCLHVLRVEQLERTLGSVAAELVTVAVQGSEALWRRVGELVPQARLAHPGAMQAPPFDGPVDLRGQLRPELSPPRPRRVGRRGTS